MHTVSGAPPLPSGRFAAALCAAGALVLGACNQPQDANPPRDDLPAMEALVVPGTGLVGEWKLDETEGTTAADSKNGYDATVFGGASFIASPLGRALNLNNGTTGIGGKYAEMPSNPALDDVQEGNYTISAWFYPYTTPPNDSLANRKYAIVGKYNLPMGLFYEEGGQFSMRHFLAGDVAAHAISTASYPLNTWHHVVGVVSKGLGTVKVFVNGDVAGTNTFTAGTAASDYLAKPFRIGRAMKDWAADGRVDQVRIYDRALTGSEIDSLGAETPGSPPQSTFRFPIAMTKGNQYDLLGQSPTPDGLEMAARSAADLQRVLDEAKTKGARIAVRVNRGNGALARIVGADTNFVPERWKEDFDAVSSVDVSDYIEDGTLVGHYAIDEPFPDFDNMTGAMLEDICEYQKRSAATGWDKVPCLIRDLNTVLYTHAPAGGYRYVDAGWAQMADHHYVPAGKYGGSMREYLEDNLEKGEQVGLALVFGFNLINGGREVSGCAKPADPNSNNCAMTAAEVRAVADTVALLGHEKGCGINGWRIDPNPGPEQDYYYSRGSYANNGIQSALLYLKNKLGSVRPLQFCTVDGNLPAP